MDASLPLHVEVEDSWQLLSDCRQNKLDAWDKLYACYKRIVISVPLHYGLSVDDAEDVVQITFTGFLKNLYHLRPDSNLSAWLCAVARRHTWRVLRRNKKGIIATPDNKQPDIETLIEGDEDSHIEDDDTIAKWEAMQWLDAAFAKLDPRCRELLQALYLDVDEPSYAEIAKRLHISIGSIGPTRGRCLDKIRQVMGEVT